jgi:nucleotide-binding universal stress UspA family protein
MSSLTTYADGDMTSQPSLLCPVDFSEGSRTALAYAAAIAEHFGARLTVMTVDDPLLANVAASTGRVPSLAEESERELRGLATETLGENRGATTIEFRVVIGKPAQEILRLAAELAAELVVMSSHGRSGTSKRFFGSTTERVLRETKIPVLVTRAHRPGALSLPDIIRDLDRIVAPVDLTAASPQQVIVAAGIAKALSMPLILMHVLEPIYVPVGIRLAIPGSDAERRADAEAQLKALAMSVARDAAAEILVVSGEPAEEIVKVADVRGAHLIIMGLHSSGLLGPRMGSVTYRVLSLTNALVLALPPRVTVDSEQSTGDS